MLKTSVSSVDVKSRTRPSQLCYEGQHGIDKYVNIVLVLKDILTWTRVAPHRVDIVVKG